MKYNLILTEKQTGMIGTYLYDMCNYVLRSGYTEKELKSMDENDRLRILISQKEEKYKKGYYIFKNLTEKEIKFIGGELDYYMSYGEKELWERAMAKRIINKVGEALDVQFQRDLKLKELGIC